MKKSDHKIVFVPFYIQCPQHRTAASSRIRAEWPAKYIDADIFQVENSYLNYDVVIFQKCYNQKFQDYATAIRRINPKVKLALDLCDAEWLTREEELKAMISLMDFVTASTNKIKKWVQYNFSGKICYKIPDGHDLEYYKETMHECREPLKLEKTPMHYVWYGNSGTIASLRAIMPTLERVTGKGDTLTIIADERARGQVESRKIDVKFVLWTLETVNDYVRAGNIVLNPRLNTPGYAVKSNNKTAMAYILGRPCIDRIVDDAKGWMYDLIKFRNPQHRIDDVNEKRPELLDKYSMEAVAQVWEKTLAKELEK